MEIRLFVYGTLRSGSGHPLAAELARRSARGGAGATAGRLFDMGEYPGMRPALGPGDRVVGEIRVWSEPSDPTGGGDEEGDGEGGGSVDRGVDGAGGSLLARLDAYEGFDPTRAESSLFVRRTVLVETTDGAGSGGRAIEAWAYFYNGTVEGRPIASGDWFER